MVSIERDGAALFVARITVRLVGFLSVIYFARALGAAALGIYFTFRSVVSVLTLLSYLGLPDATVKRISQAETDDQRAPYLTAALLVAAGTFSVVTAVVVLFGDRLVNYIELGMAVPLVLLLVGLGTCRGILFGALRGEDQISVTAGLETLGTLSRVALSVLFLQMGYGLMGLIYGSAISMVVTAALSFYFVDAGFAIPTPRAVRRLIDFARYTIGMNISHLTYTWADTMVLAFFVSKASVGIYETSWRLTGISLIGAQAIGLTLVPAVTRWHEDGNLAGIERTFATAIGYAIALVLPAVIGVAVLGEELLSVLYGFETGVTVLFVLMVGQLAQAVKYITENVLLGIDRPKEVFRTNVLSVLANVGLNFLLVPSMGMYGAAVATLATASVAVGAQLWYLRQDLSLSVEWRWVAWQVFVALAMGGAITLLEQREFVPQNTVVGVVALVGVGVVIYGCGMLAQRDVRERLRAVLS
ncbi:flippase [Haloprofundus halobius]|uniref:flippase n=1 Tax=Haloprofundus halobius TaxID=2876194 RepID=UPI001CCD7F7F|nr:flippase [Haloprofundus halobius]